MIGHVLGGEGRGAPGVNERPGREELLDDAALEASAVVANCAMNRERQLAGVNSYARELGFDPLAVVAAQTAGSGQAGTVGWLDLCCGSGRALIQAARQVREAGLAGRVDLVGVDLVDAFDAPPGSVPGLELVCAPVAAWEPARSFDLITCVHGLHYIGDKLALLTRAASWLTPAGRLAADLDLSAIRVGGRPPTRRLRSRLREAGFAYNSRRHQITCAGRRDVRLPYAYLGADDRAGPATPASPPSPPTTASPLTRPAAVSPRGLPASFLTAASAQAPICPARLRAANLLRSTLWGRPVAHANRGPRRPRFRPGHRAHSPPPPLVGVVRRRPRYVAIRRVRRHRVRDREFSDSRAHGIFIALGAGGVGGCRLPGQRGHLQTAACAASTPRVSSTRSSPRCGTGRRRATTSGGRGSSCRSGCCGCCSASPCLSASR